MRWLALCLTVRQTCTYNEMTYAHKLEWLTGRSACSPVWRAELSNQARLSRFARARLISRPRVLGTKVFLSIPTQFSKESERSNE